VELTSGPFELTLLDDPPYTPGSADKVHRYDREYSFVEGYRPVSKYTVWCAGGQRERRIHVSSSQAAGPAASTNVLQSCKTDFASLAWGTCSVHFRCQP
jgi:hypothetical protein